MKREEICKYHRVKYHDTKEYAMKNKVKKYIYEYKMLKQGDSVVVGVSGGSDSMCLLNLLIELRLEMKLNIYVVHIHHGLRGEDADKDMQYVEEFCKEHNVISYTYKFNVMDEAKKLNMSTEEAGRYLRYLKFNEVAEKYNAKIAVAHNIEDNAETVLHNMFRGTGITGMCGILPVRNNIIRPIMCLTKKEIYDYLEEGNIQYKVDSTNFTEEYTRNKIRLRVLPYVTEQINLRAVEHIDMLSKNVRETMDFINDFIDEASDKYIKQDGEKVMLSLEIRKEKSIIMTGLIRNAIKKITNSLKDITNVHIEDIKQLVNKQVGTYVCLPYGIRVERSYESLRIFLDKSEKNELIKIDIDNYGEYEILDKGTLYVTQSEYTDEIFNKTIYTKWLNCDILKGALQLRTRQEGDYIVVNEAGARKKIKDFFIDLKIPRKDRENILLLANGNEVLWVMGYRIGYNYKVHKNCEKITRFEYVEKDGGNYAR